MRALRDAGTRKWLVFGTIAIGTFMSVMDMGSVNVALPTIASHFDSDLPTVQWVTIGHALMISILLLPMARLGDTTDRKRVYMAGLAIFSLGGLAAGSAQSMGMLIGAKLFQGIGSAMIQANAMAAVLSVFPGAERGKALGSHLSVVGSGMIVGPALGGALVTGLGWRSVFFFNAPLALAALLASAVVLSSAVLSRDKPTGRVVRFDWVGAALSGAVLLVFLMVMTNGHRAGWLSATRRHGIRRGGRGHRRLHLVGAADRGSHARLAPLQAAAGRFRGECGLALVHGVGSHDLRHALLLAERAGL